jgi:hypothetical protein
VQGRSATLAALPSAAIRSRSNDLFAFYSGGLVVWQMESWLNRPAQIEKNHAWFLTLCAASTLTIPSALARQNSETRFTMNKIAHLGKKKGTTAYIHISPIPQHCTLASVQI